VPWGLNLEAPLLPEPSARAASSTLPTAGRRYVGELREGKTRLGLEVLDFDFVSSPARVRLTLDDRPLLRHGAPVEIPLHHVERMAKERRPTRFFEAGQPMAIRAALILPPELFELDDPAQT